MSSTRNSSPIQGYDPEHYWEDRLSSSKLGINLVGYSGLGMIYNTWLYNTRFHALQRGLRKLHIQTQDASIIEIGVGSGAYIPFWKSKGVTKLTGIDITKTSVRELKCQYPDLEFKKVDISKAFSQESLGIFGLVTAFDVLFHIVDEESFTLAIQNLASLIKSGGWLIVSDGFCLHPWGPTYHEYHREREVFSKELNRNGITLIHQEPIFFFMNSPLCLNNSVSSFVIQRTTGPLLRVIRKCAQNERTEWINHIPGFTLSYLDRLLGSIFHSGPSLKFWFCQKILP